MNINPKRIHPERNFSFKIEGDPKELTGISAESNEGTVVNYVLFCVAEQQWEKEGSLDGTEIVLSVETASEVAKAVRDHFAGREQEIPVLEVTFNEAFIVGRRIHVPREVAEAYNLVISEAVGCEKRTSVPEDRLRQPVFGVDEPYTTLRRGQYQREHTDGRQSSFRREQRY